MGIDRWAMRIGYDDVCVPTQDMFMEWTCPEGFVAQFLGLRLDEATARKFSVYGLIVNTSTMTMDPLPGLIFRPFVTGVERISLRDPFKLYRDRRFREPEFARTICAVKGGYRVGVQVRNTSKLTSVFDGMLVFDGMFADDIPALAHKMLALIARFPVGMSRPELIARTSLGPLDVNEHLDDLRKRGLVMNGAILATDTGREFLERRPWEDREPESAVGGRDMLGREIVSPDVFTASDIVRSPRRSVKPKPPPEPEAEPISRFEAVWDEIDDTNQK